MNYHYLFYLTIVSCVPLHAMEPLPKKPIIEQDGVRIYTTSHREKVLKIGLENITRLASTTTFSQDEYHRLVQQEIVPALESKAVTLKVYEKQGQAVGFITYRVTPQWYKKYVCVPFGPNAHILHLAVDHEHQKSGYGSVLLKDALADCKSQSVNRVTLWTTGNGWELEKYYRKFGFEITRETKVFREREYALRLNRHPAILMGVAALSWAKAKLFKTI